MRRNIELFVMCCLLFSAVGSARAEATAAAEATAPAASNEAPDAESQPTYADLSAVALDELMQTTRSALIQNRQEQSLARQALEERAPRAQEIRAEIQALHQQINTLNAELRALLAADSTWLALTTQEQELAATLRGMIQELQQRPRQPAETTDL